MDRRGFLGSLAFASGSVLVDGDTVASLENFTSRFGLSILQGFTDETTTQFSVDLPKILKVHYEAIDPQTGKIFEPTKITTSSRTFSNHKVEKIIFEGLYLNNGFDLVIRDSRNNIIDHREFKTLDTQKKNIRIALLSCMLDLNPHRDEMWKLVAKTNPEMMFMLGDNVYGDFYAKIYGPKILWMRYVHTRRVLAVYRQRKLIPTIAIWDDHDFGCNNTGGEYKYKEQSLDIFNSFYAQEPISPNYKMGPGVASSFSGFGQKFIFLDDRFWRNLPTVYDKTGYLGEDQLAWVQKELNHNEKRTWIFQGSQFFGDFKSDSGTYETIAPNELAHLAKLIRAHDKETYFGSGDVHFSEVTHSPKDVLGFNAVEVTSSCLHSLVQTQLPHSKRRIAGALKENFVIVDITPDASVFVNCIGIGKKEHFSLDISS